MVAAGPLVSLSLSLSLLRCKGHSIKVILVMVMYKPSLSELTTDCGIMGYSGPPPLALTFALPTLSNMQYISIFECIFRVAVATFNKKKHRPIIFKVYS